MISDLIQHTYDENEINMIEQLNKITFFPYKTAGGG